MAKPRINEEQITDSRSRTRQNKRTPFLINQEDGRLYPNVPLVAKSPNYRPYHGDPKASLAERMAYLEGRDSSRRKVTYTQPDEPFELGKASADEIVAFAMEEFGAALDGSMPIAKLREECYRLSHLPEIEVPTVAESAETQEETAEPRAPRRRRASSET